MLIEKTTNGFFTTIQLPEYPLPFRVTVRGKRIRVSLNPSICTVPATSRHEAFIERNTAEISQQLHKLIRGCEFAMPDSPEFVRLANALHRSQPFRICIGGEVQPEAKRILRNITVMGWNPVCTKWLDGMIASVQANVVISDPAYVKTNKLYRVHFVKYKDIGGTSEKSTRIRSGND